MSNKKSSNKPFPPEVRDRAVRMVAEQRSKHSSQWATIESIATKIGCSAPTLHGWVKKQEIDTGLRDGTTSDERQRLKDLERENKELRQANEILRKASAFFVGAASARRSSVGRPSCADRSNG